MKKIILLSVFLVALSGCFEENKKEDNKIEVIDPGSLNINYYSNKSVKSLIIPPDLTKPNYEKSFRISEYSDVKQDFVSFDNNEEKPEKVKIIQNKEDIKIEKSGKRRWLVVNKDADYLWEMSRDFLKKEGFSIKNSNKKIGIMETEYLENYPEVPDQNIGIIRSMLRKALAQRYALPIVDKYRIRIEPIENNVSEIHLSLSSMQEVVTNSGNDNENTIWQVREKDVALETEMLYRLMLFLGGDEAKSKERIVNAKEKKITLVSQGEGINGFGKLTFNLSLIETWDNLAWALDQLNIDIYDKDLKERAIYINIARTSDQGFFTWIFGDDAVRKNFQIMLQPKDNSTTDVFFNDVSEENEDETKEFSKEFFMSIAKQF